MEWISSDDLKAALGIDPADTFDDAWLAGAVDAANALVTGYRPELEDQDAADYPQVKRGTLELAVKMYRARGATDDGTGSLDVYAYAARYLDANVMTLLGIDRPVFG